MKNKRLKDLATVISSDIRLSILKILKSKRSTFSEIQRKTEELLKRKISDGSLNWHLQKLKGENFIAKGENPKSEWRATERGQNTIQLIENIGEEGS